MSSKEKSDVHHPGPESDAPKPSEGPQAEEEPRSPTETHQGRPEEAEEDKHDSEADDGSHTSEDESVDYSKADDADAYRDPRHKESPEPASAPCTCRCGGCCCHGTSSEPQHCVRCHTDFTFNHSQACSVPHVLYSYDRDYSRDEPRDLAVRSICCGSEVLVGEPIKGDWRQPFPCFLGWHTTDVDAVKEEYNGLNVLRCNPGPGGKCRRARMKHHANYDNLYDDKVNYIKGDRKDRKTYLKRKREEVGDRDFEDTFGYVGEEESFGKEKTRRKYRYY